MDDLGTVLALLHDAPSRVRRLRAEIVSRIDSARTREAFERGALSDGSRVYAYAEDDDEEPEPPQVEFRARIWADLENRRERAEREGTREGLAVRDGSTWWRWDPHNGAISNEAGEKVGTTVAEELSWLLGGIGLVAVLELTAIDRGTVAGRTTWRCRAVPRAGEDDRFTLHRLPGYGADEYELDVDAEHGLILRVAGRLDGAVFSESEVVELGVDEDLPDELFEFTSPDGSPTRSTDELHGPHHMNVTPRKLLELAGFALFAPRHVPGEWDAMLAFAGSIAMIHLRARDGLRSVQINQIDPEADEDGVGWDHANPAPWQTETHDGVEYEWREPNEDWQPARVRFVRDGTRVLIDSASLPAAELLELARAMVPLRDDAPDFGGSDEPADER